MKIRICVTLMAASATLIAIVMGTTAHTNGVKIISDSRGEPSEGFNLSARIENKQFKLGEPIVLNLTIRNITKQVLYLTETNPYSDYQLIVKSERGERVRLTEFGQRSSNNKEDFRVIGVKVKPGEERHDSIEATRLYNMTVPGTYTMIARRVIRSRKGRESAEVVSNVVNVLVVR